MKRFLIAIGIFIFTIGESFAQDDIIAPIGMRIDSLMNYYAGEYDFNGVALVAHKGTIVFEKAYGYRDIAKKEKHDANSIFQAGTITSEITAEVIFQLAAEHKLTLEDKLNKYFPDFPKGDSITIRNLLTNTSGIFDYFLHEDYFRRHDTEHVAKDSVIALIKKRKPFGVAGTHFQNSNSNYFLLGCIIEKITKKSYSEVVRERIFKPAGMTHSGFDYRGLKDKHKSNGYRSYNDNGLPLPAMDSSVIGAAASLYTTANDLYALQQALQSYKLLNKKMQDSMYIPFLHNYAYGWYIDTLFNKTGLFLGSEIKGSSCYILRVPSDDLCIVLMQNISRPAYDENSIVHKIAGIFYDENYTLPIPVPVIFLNAAQLAHYEGTYLFPSGVSVIVTTNGNKLHVHNLPLKGTEDKIDDFELEPIALNKFKTRSLKEVVEFVSDNTGNISTLVFHTIKHDIAAKKQTNQH